VFFKQFAPDRSIITPFIPGSDPLLIGQYLAFFHFSAEGLLIERHSNPLPNT
jgi:hypothetical protein